MQSHCLQAVNTPLTLVRCLQNISTFPATSGNSTLQYVARSGPMRPTRVRDATRKAMANRAMDNLHAALLGERPRDLVNPQVWKG
ncbi:D-glycerate dehydrogenase [Pseudomonas sp. S37]|nr:D-glycerate dehydrogenase [Pseudomonas sp. S37]